MGSLASVRTRLDLHHSPACGPYARPAGCSGGVSECQAGRASRIHQGRGGTGLTGWMRISGAFFLGQLPETPVVPAPLQGTSISVGDEGATVIPVGTTDSALSTVVHVPPRPSRVGRCGLQPNPRVAEGVHAGVESQLETRARYGRRPRRRHDQSPGIGILKSSTMMRDARSRRVANTSPTLKLRWLAAPALAI
jgi:hypothetical protein